MLLQVLLHLLHLLLHLLHLSHCAAEAAAVVMLKNLPWLLASIGCVLLV
jgi:hypothetical protein